MKHLSKLDTCQACRGPLEPLSPTTRIVTLTNLPIKCGDFREPSVSLSKCFHHTALKPAKHIPLRQSQCLLVAFHMGSWCKDELLMPGEYGSAAQSDKHSVALLALSSLTHSQFTTQSRHTPVQCGGCLCPHTNHTRHIHDTLTTHLTDLPTPCHVHSDTLQTHARHTPDTIQTHSRHNF